ncbi:ATP-binding protein [Dactylosporangium sp. NPDC005555]|uniref:ATP-binding protein n=1 Tax=Dactylosporangium sp. NPDC005555 TaxID=3154889 RepID=UPI00339EFF4D
MTAERHRWYGSMALAAVVLVLGALATLGVTVVISGKERRSAQQAIERQSDLAAAAVAGEVRRYVDTIDNVAAALGSHDGLSPQEFTRATAKVPGEALAGATALVFVVPAGAADVATVQEGWRAAGATGLTLRPADGLQEHYFGVYARQLDGNAPLEGGTDLGGNPDLADVLRQSRRTGRAAVSNAALLALDASRPAGAQRRTLSLATPVTGPAGELRGWVVLGLRGEGFFGGALGEVLHRRVTATLSATQTGGGLLPIATVHRLATPRDALRRSQDIGIAQRLWHLEVSADPRDLPGAYTDRPLVATASGAVLTVLVTLLVYLLSTRRSKAMILVHEATGELRAAEREARNQAALQQAILTSLGEGVTVVGADGRVLLHNPAARQLLGTDGDPDTLEDWPAHYGAYLPDRATPFPAAELPMVKALRGVSVDRVEMVIRNATHPDGILVSVSARPLDRSAGGPRGAVAVLHDITALRRYETELAQFAAVVAHDLKSPLTAVHGFAAVAADALSVADPLIASAPPAGGARPAAAAEPDSPEARRGGLTRSSTARAAVERVRQGAIRMRSIIDDLLAYTTARDAPLNLTEVDLRAIVESVVAERTAPVPPADLAMASSAGRPPAPVVHIGDLPEIKADPGLLRLVVDNLVGNAIKYTPAGRTPHVEVTADAGPDGIHLVVADRGIGIPDDEKARVFESFYRARPVDYGGTGLGLAICRRIVERHGGSIAVEDNPGGGTRFRVTLPLTAAAEPDPIAALRTYGTSGDAGWERLMRPSDTTTPAAR